MIGVYVCVWNIFRPFIMTGVYVCVNYFQTMEFVYTTTRLIWNTYFVVI